MPDLPSPDINDLDKLDPNAYQIVNYDKNAHKISVHTPWYSPFANHFIKTTIDNDVLNVMIKTVESISLLLLKLDQQNKEVERFHFLESKISSSSDALMRIYQAALEGELGVNIGTDIIEHEMCKLTLLQKNNEYAEQTGKLYQIIKQKLKNSGLKEEQIDKSKLLALIFSFIRAISKKESASVYDLKKKILSVIDELLSIPTDKYHISLDSLEIDRILQTFIT